MKTDIQLRYENSETKFKYALNTGKGIWSIDMPSIWSADIVKNFLDELGFTTEEFFYNGREKNGTVESVVVRRRKAQLC